MDTPSSVVRRALSTACWTVLVALTVVAPVVVAVVDPTPERLVVATAWGLVVGYALLVLFRRESRASDESVWELIPRRQYGGRHVEFGGLSRDEQESALDDVRHEAADRRRVERER